MSRKISEEQYQAINQIIAAFHNVAYNEFGESELHDIFLTSSYCDLESVLPAARYILNMYISNKDWAEKIEYCQHEWEKTGIKKLSHPPLNVIKCEKCGKETNVQTTPVCEHVGNS